MRHRRFPRPRASRRNLNPPPTSANLKSNPATASSIAFISGRATTCADMAATETFLRVSNYDLDATLDSGQAFRWQPGNGCWTGVIGRHRVRLTRTHDGIRAKTAGPVADWQWLHDYLQTGTDLDAILK